MEPVLFFYRYTCLPDRAAPSPVGPWVAEIWHPTGAQIAPHCGLSSLRRITWIGFHHLRIFRNRNHAVVLIRRADGTCVHRTLIFPPYFRFPFMASDDLQFGDIWTHPDERGQGLADTGLSLAIHHAWRPGRQLWYLAEETNQASCRLAIKSGFHLAGCGRRTRRLGLKIFGQFVVTTPSHAIQ
jgi:RimJ/RimL family protein N-acetyltransferase